VTDSAFYTYAIMAIAVVVASFIAGALVGGAWRRG